MIVVETITKICRAYLQEKVDSANLLGAAGFAKHDT